MDTAGNVIANFTETDVALATGITTGQGSNLFDDFGSADLDASIPL